jgi:probable rRNA maturation factor
MNNVDVSVQDAGLPAWHAAAAEFAESVLCKLEKDNWDVSIVFCSADFIRQLNKTYRGKDESTDVLSFAQEDDPGAAELSDGAYYAGDIVISLENLAENAHQFSVSQNEELQRLLIHGLLHLAGMDHKTNDPAEAMLLRQEAILRETCRNIVPC